MTMAESTATNFTTPTVANRPLEPGFQLDEKVSVRHLNFYYGDNRALKNVNVPLYAGLVTAFVGPSGCGKSTLLRVLNRIYDLYPNQRAEGEVLLDDQNVLSSTLDLNLLRARVGMVFQKPTPFPMSIYENIAFGIRLYERLSKADLDARVESALRRAALWDEVKDKLGVNGLSLSGGPPARRALLGARSDRDRQDRGADRRAQRRLHDRVVTHNMQQAARVSDYTAFMFLGELVEFGSTTKIFTSPSERHTQDYITGRFG
jgi:phosphate transport system ATP-binding protein